jgi:hypothetical protein
MAEALSYVIPGTFAPRFTEERRRFSLDKRGRLKDNASSREEGVFKKVGRTLERISRGRER